MERFFRPLGIPLWPLALLCALLPIIAAHLGWIVSTVQELIPACNPYIDGCVSISRASRYGLANLLFKMFMLPAATAQALCWLAASEWLRQAGVRTQMPAWLGLLAACALVLYATFLGSDGRTYELLRRYGIYLYFGGTYLALTFTLRAMRSLPAVPPARRPLLFVACACLLIGLLSLVSSYGIHDEGLRDRLENVLEWHVALLLTSTFAILAWAWRREELRITLE